MKILEIVEAMKCIMGIEKQSGRLCTICQKAEFCDDLTAVIMKYKEKEKEPIEYPQARD